MEPDRRRALECRTLPSWGDVASVCGKAIVLLSVLGLGVGVGAGIAVRILIFLLG